MVVGQSAGRSIRIGLLWHSASSGNLGVGALTIANMAIATAVAQSLNLQPHFTIIGMRDGEVASYVGPDEADVFVIDRRSLSDPAGAWAVLGRQDCVLDIGSGDSFADIYGAKRFFFLWATKVITLLRRRPLILSPQTIGPFTRQPYIALAKLVLERASVVVARDELSFGALQQLAPRSHAVQAVDVAFALPFDDRGAERAGPRLRVGVNVSGLLFNDAEAGVNRFGLGYDYANLMRRFLGRLASRGDAEIHLVTHAVSTSIPHDDDARVADRLHDEFPEAVRVAQFDSPSAAKSYISSLDFLVSGRMHACIAALSSGVAVVPTAYSRKFTGLFGMLGYQWLVPVAGMDEDAALAHLETLLDRRAELAEDAAQCMTKVGALLENYRSELSKVMSNCVAGAR